MAVAAAHVEAEALRELVARELFDGKDQQAPRAQRAGGGVKHGLEVPEVTERVRRDDQVEASGMGADELRQLALDELVVAPCRGLLEHGHRAVDANEPPHPG